MTDNLALYLKGLVLVFAWMELGHRVGSTGRRRSRAQEGTADGSATGALEAPAAAAPRGLLTFVARRAEALFPGLSPFLLFLLLVLLARPSGGGLVNGLTLASLTLIAGTLAADCLLHAPSARRSLAGATGAWVAAATTLAELAAYAVLAAHGLTIQFASTPGGGMLYFTAWAPFITCLWLFAFSRVLRLATVLPGLFEGMLALLAYLFMGSLYLQRQAASDTYRLVLIFAGVTSGLWYYAYWLRPTRIGPVAAASWAMAAGVLSMVGTSKRLAFLSIVPPTLVLLAPVFFFTYLIVGSYLAPKIGERQAGRVAYRWNFTPDRLTTILLLFCLLGNLVALVGCLTRDVFLLVGPGLFAAVLLWRLVAYLVRMSRAPAPSPAIATAAAPSVAAPGADRDALPILGIPIWRRSEDELLDRLAGLIRDGRKHVVVTPDSLALLRSLGDDVYRDVLVGADVCIPDGAGVVWAGDFLYESPVLTRIPGVELVERLLERARDAGFSAYFLGSTGTVIRKARDVLAARYPGLRIAGVRDGFFSPDEEDGVIAGINAAAPDMVFVAMGVPKQEMWIARTIGRLDTSLMMGVGGTFDVISGEKARAPLWLQRSGLEWLYRAVREPHRIKRIAVLPMFVVEVLKEKLNGAGHDAPCQTP
jgi:N-acetylglucosaminyldiphosphoundecaprenol N-acetyl-beta-D-mannosaminyltransferase